MPKPHMQDDSEFAEMTPNIMPAKIREQIRRRDKSGFGVRKMRELEVKPKLSPMKRFKSAK